MHPFVRAPAATASGSPKAEGAQSLVASPAAKKGGWYMKAVDNFVAWFKKLFGGRKK
jgi:hypothetical protein